MILTSCTAQHDTAVLQQYHIQYTLQEWYYNIRIHTSCTAQLGTAVLQQYHIQNTLQEWYYSIRIHTSCTTQHGTAVLLLKYHTQYMIGIELQYQDSYFLYCTAWYSGTTVVSYTVHVRNGTTVSGFLLPVLHSMVQVQRYSIIYTIQYMLGGIRRGPVFCYRGFHSRAEGGGRRGRRGGRYRRAKLKARQSSVMVTAVAHSQPDSEQRARTRY